MANGSAQFATGSFLIESSSNAYTAGTFKGDSTGAFDGSNDKFILNPTSGTIQAGPINISSSTGYGAQVDMEPNAATVKAQCQQTASQYTELFAGYMGSNKYFAVNAQGDATFNGTITAGAYSFANLTEL